MAAMHANVLPPQGCAEPARAPFAKPRTDARGPAAVPRRRSAGGPLRRAPLLGGAWRAALLVAAVAFALPHVAATPPPPPLGVNWATPALGAAATANSAGHWAGYTAEPRFALDDSLDTYWSSTGGDVCCTETTPAWLLVSLGAPRPVATLRLVYRQDLTFTLLLANASAGPFMLAAPKTCDTCELNAHAEVVQRPLHVRAFTLPRTVTAAYVKLVITWSEQGGIGGCNDICDWSTDVHKFEVFSPGVVPPLDTPQVEVKSRAPQEEVLASACAPQQVVLLDQQRDTVLLTDGAAQRPPGGDGPRGAAYVQLTASAPLQSGAMELPDVVRLGDTCGCVATHVARLLLYVRIDGGQASLLPGEGMVVSLVDASKQTPGRTEYVRGACGLRAALPAHAISVVFDSGDDADPRCDWAGTGARVVSTLQGDAPPAVLASTLNLRASAFRSGTWLQLGFEIVPRLVYSQAAAPPAWLPYRVHLNGTELLDPFITAASWPATTDQLDSFYIVVSARTSAAAADAHAVADARVTCSPRNWDVHWENWAGFRQPYTPPGALAVAQQPQPAGRAGPSAAALSLVAFAVAFAATAALFSAAAVAHKRRDTPLPTTAGRKQLPPPLPPAGVPPPVSPETARLSVLIVCNDAEARMADEIRDKLRLGGMMPRTRALAGATPSELLESVRCSDVVVAMVSLPWLHQLAGAAEPGAPPDAMLAVCLAALHFLEESPRARRAAPALLPLLVRPEPEAGPARAVSWSNPAATPDYAALLRALPDAAPAATAAALDAALREAHAPLRPDLASLTVRALLLGSGPPRRAVLGHAPCVLACPLRELDLYVPGRLVPAIEEAVARCA